MIGPCLCGDPYCPSCGNPAQAEMADMVADFIEKLKEEIDPFIENEGDLKVFRDAGLSALKAHKEAEKEAIKHWVDEERFCSQMETDELKAEIARLKGEL